jgi:hypothetical protein
MPEWAGSAGAVQELRRLDRALSAWQEAIRPDQVLHSAAAPKNERWVHEVGCGGSADSIDITTPPPPTPPERLGGTVSHCAACTEARDPSEPR